MTGSDKSDWERIASVALSWWQRLQPLRADDEPNPDSDRGALARLRRAGSLAEIMAEEATLDLYHRLGFLDRPAECQLPRIAMIAHVLAHIRKNKASRDDGKPLSAIAAVGRQKSDDDSPKLKPIRFRRLLAAREDDELMREMRRLVVLADRTINVGDLAASLLWWNDAIRTRWAFDYYAAGMAAPSAAA